MRKPFALLGLGLALGAQTPEQDGEALLARALGDTQLRAAARRSQGAEEAPADVTVLSGEELRALGYRTLGAALAGVLGFRDNDDGAYANVGVRGLYVLGDQNTRILVLLDGHPLNSAADVGSSKVGEDLGIPLECIDHLEIIRGPASSLYGNNAFLGVVQVVTREALGGTARGFQGALTAGSGGLSDLWGSLSLPGPGFTVGFQVGAMARRGTSRDLQALRPESLPAEVDREDRAHAYLVVKGPTWGFSAYLMNRVQHLPHAPFASEIGNPGNRYRNRLAFGEARWEPRLGETQVLARAFWDWNLFSDQLVSDGLRDPAFDAGTWTDRDLDQGLGAELQARRPVAEAWTLTGGLEQTWHRFAYTLSGPGTFNPREIRYRVRKVYAEAEWTPAAAWALTLGLQRAELLLDEAQAPLNPARAFTLGRYGRWSPRGAVVWRPSDRDTLKGLYSEGFRNPTLFERFSEDDGLSFVDNPDLTLESLKSGGVVWLRDWGGGWTSQVGAHALRWSGAIRAVDLSPVQQQFQNDGADLRGRVVEVQARWQGGPWDVLGTAAFNRWRRLGEEVDNAARSQAGLRGIWRRGGLSLALEWRGVGARDLRGEGRIPFQDSWRASVRWERGPAWVQLTGEDLLDHRPEQWIASDYAPLRRLPGEGRRFRVEAGWRF